MHVQAWSELMAKYGIRVNLVPAAAQRVGIVEELDQSTGVIYAAVGAEVTRAVSFDAAREEYAGEGVGGYADPGIGLGVLEEDVVLWLVLLDEIVLQQQRIGLAVHNRILGIGDSAYEHPGLGVEL